MDLFLYDEEDASMMEWTTTINPNNKLQRPQAPTMKIETLLADIPTWDNPGSSSSSSILITNNKKPLVPVPSSIDARRKRNREGMARARRRQREQMLEMQTMVQKLEHQYEMLRRAAEVRGLLHDDETYRSNSDMSSMSDSDSYRHRESAYIRLADLSRRAQGERTILEHKLREKEKIFLRMQQVMIDREQELVLPCPIETLSENEKLYSDFEFIPLTQEQAQERIRRCYQQVCQLAISSRPLSVYDIGVMSSEIESPIASPLPDVTLPASAASTPRAPLPTSATFGWEVSSQISAAHDFFVCCSKFFPGLNAFNAMQQSWERDTQPRVKFLSLRPRVRYEVLQVLNDNTYVVGIDLKHPVKQGKLMRSMDLRFRLATETGYVMGRSSVNPISNELRAHAETNYEYFDSSSWISFTPQIDATTGEEGCLIKFYARTEYNTNEDMYLRLVNVLSAMLQWENVIVPSSLKLVA